MLQQVAVALVDVEAQARRHERALVLARGLVAGALLACDEGLVDVPRAEDAVGDVAATPLGGDVGPDPGDVHELGLAQLAGGQLVRGIGVPEEVPRDGRARRAIDDGAGLGRVGAPRVRGGGGERGRVVGQVGAQACRGVVAVEGVLAGKRDVLPEVCEGVDVGAEGLAVALVEGTHLREARCGEALDEAPAGEAVEQDGDGDERGDGERDERGRG